ncbi:MAG TPA: caspase family protein [Acidobacteriaceae bacterium]|jgi:uncharacterized caspase-like protein|nr:caspase family protein [Acidobacteriaceae bacterium]
MSSSARSWAGALALLAAVACLQARAQDETMCGGGKDLVVQALERVTPTSSNDAYQDALELLKHAVSSCAELGDAWYYRSLVERRLGNTRLADFSLTMAKRVGSEAMDQSLDPFILATPIATRAIAANAPQQGEAPASAPATAGPVQQKWALVVGIGQFQDPLIPVLHFTTDDAKSFAAELVDPNIGRFPPDHVLLLTDSQATTVAIKEALNKIARLAGYNDEVVIYVATHGSPRSMDVAGANYIVTYDTKFETDRQVDEDALYATALPMVQLANAVATRMKALRTVVILDTCFSGGAVGNESKVMVSGIGNAAPSQKTLDRMAEGTGRIVLAAASEQEESLESPTLQHGYFTWFLLQALKKDNGLDPLTDIYAAVAQDVSQRVAHDAQLAHQSLAQHPVMSRSSNQADFALGIAPGGAGTAAKSGR